jgi:hypothetical protein
MSFNKTDGTLKDSLLQSAQKPVIGLCPDAFHFQSLPSHPSDYFNIIIFFPRVFRLLDLKVLGQTYTYISPCVLCISPILSSNSHRCRVQILKFLSAELCPTIFYLTFLMLRYLPQCFVRKYPQSVLLEVKVKL